MSLCPQMVFSFTSEAAVCRHIRICIKGIKFACPRSATCRSQPLFVLPGSSRACVCVCGQTFKTRHSGSVICLHGRRAKLTGCRSLMLIGSSLRVSSRSSCVLRPGMLHIYGREGGGRMLTVMLGRTPSFDNHNCNKYKCCRAAAEPELFPWGGHSVRS